MTEPVLVVGSYLSPYVRKVLAALEWKGIPYRIDPIVPFYGDERFASASPLRRVPVLVDGAVVLSDSSVICQYLEDRHPSPPLYPADVADRARARWIEEFADTRMGDVVIWRLFNQVAIGPAVWGRPTDRDVVRRATEEELPAILDYLEGQAGPGPFFFGDSPSIADVSVAALMRNAAFCRYAVDAVRWPRVAALVARTLELPVFASRAAYEALCLRTPIAAQREALREAGAPLAAETWGTATPQPGVMGV